MLDCTCTLSSSSSSSSFVYESEEARQSQVKKGEATIVRPGHVFIFTVEPLLVMTAALTVFPHSQKPSTACSIHPFLMNGVYLSQQHLDARFSNNHDA